MTDALAALSPGAFMERCLAFPRARLAGRGNAAVKEVRALLKGHGPEDTLVASDFPLCRQALNAGLPLRLFVLCADAVTSGPARQTALDCLGKAEQTILVDEHIFSSLVTKDRHTGMMAVVHQPVRSLDDAGSVPALSLVLDGIEQAGNVGSLLRSADGAGAGAVFLTGRRVRLNAPALVAASRGACFFLPQYVCEPLELHRWFEERGVSLVAADPAAAHRFDEVAYPFPLAVLVGNERGGVDPFWRERADLMVSIPMRGHCDSLNVATAATMVLYQAARGLDAAAAQEGGRGDGLREH